MKKYSMTPHSIALNYSANVPTREAKKKLRLLPEANTQESLLESSSRHHACELVKGSPRNSTM